MPKIEQTTNRNELQCYLDIGTMMNYFDPTTNKELYNLLESMFNGIGKGESNVISGTDTIKGFVWNEIIDATGGMKKGTCRRENITEKEYEEGAKKGEIVMKTFIKNLGKSKLEVYVNLINKNKINKKYEEGARVDINFRDDSNEYYSKIKFPKECDVLDIKPFFGTKTNEELDFGVYIKYRENDKTYELIAYVMYNYLEKYAKTFYAKIESQKEGIGSFIEDYK